MKNNIINKVQKTVCIFLFLATFFVIQEPALASSVNAITGSLQWDVLLPKQVFTSVALPDLVIPAGEPATVQIAADAAIQGNITSSCEIISQVIVDGVGLGNQTIDQMASGGTIDIRHYHVVISVDPGTHPVALQIYPECDGLAVARVPWGSGSGIWGGNYSYLVFSP